MFEATTITNGSTEALLPGLAVFPTHSPLDAPQIPLPDLPRPVGLSSPAFDLALSGPVNLTAAATPLDLARLAFWQPDSPGFSQRERTVDSVLPQGQAVAPLAGDLDLIFNSFENATGFNFNGNATLFNRNLRLTRDEPNLAGSVYWAEPLAIDNNTSFQSRFSFRMHAGDGTLGGSGLAFILQNTVAEANALGAAGGGIGYASIGDRSLAIEFDTTQDAGDVNNNHVSLLQGGHTNNALATAIPAFDLNAASPLNTWVNYDGPTNTLDVYLSDQLIRPAQPLLSTTVDLAAKLQGQAYLGFSGGTSNNSNIQAIRQWSFSTLELADTTMTLRTSDIDVNENAGFAAIDVIRTGALNRTSTVDYSTANDTAFAGEDYRPQAGTLTFAPGEALKTIRVSLNNDSRDEVDEQFSLSIGNETNALLGSTRSALIKIRDEDPPPPGNFFQFSLEQFKVSEGGGAARVLVKRTGDLSNFASVRLRARDDEAHSNDYTPLSKKINFRPGKIQRELWIPIKEDSLPELGEDIQLQLVDPVGAELGVQAEASVRIVDNDRHPFSVTSDTVVDLGGTGRRAGITAFDWAPDGTLFIAQADGVISRWKQGKLQPVPFLDISAQIGRNATTLGQGGVMSMVLHPDFPDTPYVYFAMSTNLYDPPGPAQESDPYSYLIRVEADPQTGYSTAIAGSERVLLKIPTNDQLFHATGNLKFGADGSLFYSHGDSSLAVSVGGTAFRSLDINSPQGKVFRINPLTGAGYGNNPFATADLSQIRSKVYSYGLRNPFRFTIKPGTSEPFIGDVGQTSWEEINTGRGRNFGWPLYEGGNRESERQPANANQPGLQDDYRASRKKVTAPLYALNHRDNGNAIIVGDFNTGNAYPALFRDALFFSDFGSGDVNAVLFDEDGAVESVTPFTTAENVVFSAQGPDGLLYYSNLNDGTINRWIVDS